MRFVVENFGPVRQADVTLGSLTVFVGPGGTGKSYLAYLIWTLRRMVPDWEVLGTRIPESEAFKRVAEEMKEGKTVISQEAADELIEHVMRVHADAFVKMLPEWLKGTFSVEGVGELVTWGEKRSVLRVSNDEGTRGFELEICEDGSIRQEGLDNFFEGERFEMKFYREMRKLALLHDGKELCEGAVEDLNSPERSLHMFCAGMIPCVFASVLDGFSPCVDIHMLTDSRAGFLRIAPSLLRGLPGRRGLPLNLPDHEMLSTLAEISSSRITSENISRIAAFVEEELGGRVIVRSTGFMFPELFFSVKREIPVLRAHSVVRECTPLIAYLRHVLSEGSALVVEEPEAHAHPYMQTVIARALAMLSKCGVEVLMTTHSPLILDELSNLVRLNALDADEKRKQGYREDEGLDWRSLKVYRFNLDGTVGEMRVTEGGIDEEEFSSVIVELSNRYADVEEARWRKLHGRRGDT